MNPDPHPDVQQAIDREADYGFAPTESVTVDCARRQFRTIMTSQATESVEDEYEFAIDGPGGPLPIHVYDPTGEESQPVFVFLHGGGWVLGDPACYASLCTRLANRTGHLVLSVDYRLAPEHPFPAALHDAYQATEWATDHADAIGGDPGKITVGGTSAGGNLSIGVGLHARDHAGPRIRQQVALYPVVASPVHHAFESYREYATGYPLTVSGLRYFTDQYVSDPVDHRNPYAFPLEARDLSNLPPTILCSAGYDPLFDEAAEFERRLRDAGVPVSHHRYASMTHDFLSMTDDIDRAEDAIDAIAADVRDGSGEPT